MWSSTNDDSRKLSKLKTFLGIFFFYYDLRVLHLLEERERERERESMLKQILEAQYVFLVYRHLPKILLSLKGLHIDTKYFTHPLRKNIFLHYRWYSIKNEFANTYIEQKK